MSFGAYIEMKTEHNISSICEMLFDGMQYTKERRGNEVLIGLERGGAIVSKILDVNDSFSHCWGLLPNLQVHFPNIIHIEVEVTQIAVNGLRFTSEDLALVFNDALLMLIRQLGRTTRNSDEHWTSEMIAVIDIPHQVLPLPIC